MAEFVAPEISRLHALVLRKQIVGLDSVFESAGVKDCARAIEQMVGPDFPTIAFAELRDRDRSPGPELAVVVIWKLGGGTESP